MSRASIGLDDRLQRYLLDVSLRDSSLLRRLRDETAALAEARMQIAPEQGQLLALLVRAVAARRIIEVGTFTGYSALVMALALPDDGCLVACDLSEEWTAIARRYWAEAGVADRIDLYLAPAADTLDRLIGEGGAGTYDVAFIDADKENYPLYYERALTLLRTGGLVAVDNVLWGGRVADAAVTDADTVAIRAFNRLLRDDERVDLSLIPIGDGLTVARKR